MALDTRGFYPDTTPNNALFKIADTLTENVRYSEQKAYRKEKDAEADNWRKVNMVQDLTDLSKHQTSSDVANAVANQKGQEVLQKYTALANKLSYADLQGGISKEMSGIIGGINALKTELDQFEASTKILKQQNPSLDVNSLSQAQREDVLKRRLGEDGSFVNPMTVAPPTIDITDPNTLSKYLLDTKNLDNTIIKAAGAEPVEIASGDPYTNVVYGGKMPFWMDANFKPEEVKGGFLKKGFVPQLSIKSEDLPADMFPALKGSQRKIVTSDVHEQFKSQHPLEVISGTRKMFPTYDEMSEGEKGLAERDYLYTKLKGLDQSNFQYKSSKSPTITHNRTTVNNSSKKEEPTWDLTEYPTVSEGGKDITVPFQGYTVTAIGKEKLLAKRVLYFPEDKSFIVTEYTGRDEVGNPTGETTKEYSAKTFRQNIQGMNPGTDMKPFDALVSDRTKTGSKEATPQPAKKEIKRSDISSKAAAAGYTVKEYEALLNKNGIKIIN